MINLIKKSKNMHAGVINKTQKTFLIEKSERFAQFLKNNLIKGGLSYSNQTDGIYNNGECVVNTTSGISE